MLKVRIVEVDYYLAKSKNEDIPGSDTKLPVIRIFGTTCLGIKCCVHLHDCFPYVSVRWNGPLNEEMVKLFSKNINESLSALSNHKRSKTFVYKIEIVKSRSMYGFHEAMQTFIRIYLYNPNDIKKLNELFIKGLIFNKVFQPYQSHIPYILQMFIDQNLFGMNFIYLSEFKIRKMPDDNILIMKSRLESIVPSLSITLNLYNNLPKQTFCELEIDSTLQHLKNKDVYQMLNYSAYPGIDDLINDDINLRKFYSFEEPPSFGIQTRENITMLPSEKRGKKLIENALNSLRNQNAQVAQLVPESEIITICQDFVREIDDLDDKSDFSTPNDSSGGDEELTASLADKITSHRIDRKGSFKVGEFYQLDGKYDGASSKAHTRRTSMNRATTRKTYYPQIVEKKSNNEKDQNVGSAKIKVNIENPDDSIQSSCLSCASQETIIKIGPTNERGAAALQHSKKVLRSRLITSIHPIVKTRRNQSKSGKDVSSQNSQESVVKIYSPKVISPQKITLSATTQFKEEFPLDSRNVLCLKPSLKPIQLPNNKEKLMFKYMIADETAFTKPTTYYTDTEPRDFTFIFRSPYPDIVFPELETENPLLLKDFYQDSVDGIGKVLNLGALSHLKNSLAQNVGSKFRRTNHSLLIKPALNPVPITSSQQIIEEHPHQDGNDLKKVLFKEASFCNLQGLQQRNYITASLLHNKADDIINLQRVQHITSMSCEVHAKTRGDLLPNPQFDSVQAIFFTIYNDAGKSQNHEESQFGEPGGICSRAGNGKLDFEAQLMNGFCMVCDGEDIARQGKYYASVFNADPCLTHLVSSESELLASFSKDVLLKYDPDVLIGFEIEKSTWGYLSARAHCLGIVPRGEQYLSRIVCNDKFIPKLNKPASKEFGERREPDLAPIMRNPFSDQQFVAQTSIPGRVLLNGWRIVRKHLACNNYTFENVYYRLLERRTAKYSHKTLNAWFAEPTLRWRVAKYYFIRTMGVHSMLEKMDTIDQTSEFARLYGVEFHNVLHRGSQYKVESMMLRLAQAMGFIPMSPLPIQRNRMSMSQTMPLVIEPEAGLYTDPVIVLDFQSLYPSIIIAYNYCYSTCLGYLNNWAPDGQAFKFGCSELCVDLDFIEKMKSSIHVSPVGVGFVSKDTRLGVLPSMLYKILNARIRVKNSMKALKRIGALEPYLEKLLDARQLALKMIANVTYGYTSAYFSGRMPCVEIADSIVSKGREILQKAIDYITSRKGINARVVYGDTDSIFVLLKGHSRIEAFDIGEMLAKEVSEIYVQPVELKFEKVYQPCVLQSKKRYVGFSYESKSELEPKYDAKGIETVRRDFCAAVPKVLECVITELFKTGNISNVRLYLEDQWEKIIQAKVCLQDFIIAKEYRGRSGYKPKACVPALEIAKRSVKIDPMSEPLIKERVSYVIITPEQQGNLRQFQHNMPLINLVRTPYEFLQMGNARLNSEYYITKQLVPPINRVMKLIGFDVLKWYQDMTRNLPISRLESLEIMENVDCFKKDESTLKTYFNTKYCFICRTQSRDSLCPNCLAVKDRSAFHLGSLMQKWSQKYRAITDVCKNCTGFSDPHVKCLSMDCPAFYHLVDGSRKMSRVSVLDNMQNPVDQHHCI